MPDSVKVAGLAVMRPLHDFMAQEALPGTGVTPEQFWSAYAGILRELMPRNDALLARRAALQAEIDAWYRAYHERPVPAEAHADFLREIGYLVPEGPDFQVGTAGVDDEMAHIAGPQLVVPVSNARYALNAA